MKTTALFGTFMTLMLTFSSSTSYAKNLHIIDPLPEVALSKKELRKKNKNAENTPKLDAPPAHKDFAMYRTGRMLSAREFDDMVCGPEGKPEQAISEIWVLSDKHGSDEKQYNDPKSPIWNQPENKGYVRRCDKTIQVQNFNQSVRDSPLTKEFLAKFDKYVINAREKGLKIAFRCDCGCHRTGRLAAYYQMRFMGMKPEETFSDMRKYAHGKPDAVGKAAYWLIVANKLKKQTRAMYDYIHGKPCSTRAKFCVTDEAKANLLIGKNGEDYEDMDERQLARFTQTEDLNDGEEKRLPASILENQPSHESGNGFESTAAK